MSIEDFIRSQAEKQLDKATKAITEGDWVDSLTKKLSLTKFIQEIQSIKKSESKKRKRKNKKK